MTLVIPEGLAEGVDVQTERDACPICHTTFRARVAGGAREPGALAQHRDRCAQETPEAREFYRQHRRWPSRRGKRMETTTGAEQKPTDLYETPDSLYGALSARYGPYDLDAAASRGNTKCALYLTRELDALSRPWLGPKVTALSLATGELVEMASRRAFCNPPYSQPNIPSFMRHARAQVASADEKSLASLVVPAVPGEGWFHEHVFRGADVHDKGTIHHGPLKGTWFRFSAVDCDIELLFLRGRVTFLLQGVPAENSGKTGTAVVTFAARGTLR